MKDEQQEVESNFLILKQTTNFIGHCRQIFRVRSEKTQVNKIGENASQRDQSYVNTRHEVFILVQALAWSNSPTSSIDVLCY
jgi:hypothetical protein